MSNLIRTTPSSHIFATTVEDVSVGQLDPETGAETIEHTALALENLETGLETLWIDIMETAATSDTAHDKLRKLLLHLSKRPDSIGHTGNVIKFYGATLWKDLPMFGWEVNGIWNSLNVPEDDPRRHDMITRFMRVNRFVAVLVRGKEAIFEPYRLQILWTFREGLETSSTCSKQKDAVQIWVPAIAAVVDVLGSEIESWQDQYGNPGKGHELWNGEPGFSKERWTLWRSRLEEIAKQEGVDEEVKKLAGETVNKMND